MDAVKQNVAIHEIKNEQIVYMALFVNVLFTVMNTSMFNVAIPSIAEEFRVSPATVSWLVICYSIFFAIGTVMYGTLANSFPIKKLMTIGLILLGIGSLAGMSANHFTTLLVARVLQASGASCIPGLAMVVSSKYIPVHRRGTAMGKISAGATLGFGLGPLLGGMITEYAGWAFLFAITLLAVVTIPIYRKHLPDEELEKEPFDVIGLITLCVGVISTMLAITSKQPLFLFGSVFLFVFLRHVKKVKHPFIPYELLQMKGYLMMIGLSFLIFFINFSVLFTSPLFLSETFGVSTAQIGLILFPGAITSAMASVYIGSLIDRLGPGYVLGIGIASMILATFLLSGFSYLSKWTILVFYLIASIGFSSVTTAVPSQLSQVLKVEQLGVGLGTLQLLQFFGGAFGVSVSGGIIGSAFFKGAHLNFFWGGSQLSYSNVYLILFVLSWVAFAIYYFLMRTQVADREV